MSLEPAQGHAHTVAGTGQGADVNLLLFELEEVPGVPLDDVLEVSNYVAALEHGLHRLKEGFPLSNRLIREIHGVLLSRGRGSGKAPGEFRHSQNWIGGSRPGNAVFVGHFDMRDPVTRHCNVGLGGRDPRCRALVCQAKLAEGRG